MNWSDPIGASIRVFSETALVIDLDDTLIDARRTRREALAVIDALAVEHFATDPHAVLEHADAVLEDLWPGSPFVEEFLRLGCAATDALWVDFSGPGSLLSEIRQWMPGFRAEFWKTLCGRARARRPGNHSMLGEAFVQERRTRIRAFPGVRDALAQLRARFPLALLTNGPSDLQRLKLKQTGLELYFDAVIVSAEAGVAKPSPDIFVLACDALGSRAERTMMVGDDWATDGIGARHAGLTPLLVRTGGPERRLPSQELMQQGVPVLDRFTDLPRFLLARCWPNWATQR